MPIILATLLLAPLAQKDGTDPAFARRFASPVVDVVQRAKPAVRTVQLSPGCIRVVVAEVVFIRVVRYAGIPADR